MITTEAVEALAVRNFTALYRKNDGTAWSWADAPSSLRAGFLSEARKQCEVVAPHLLSIAAPEIRYAKMANGALMAIALIVTAAFVLLVNRASK